MAGKKKGYKVPVLEQIRHGVKGFFANRRIDRQMRKAKKGKR